MTEDEAFKRWCPFARCPEQGVNRDGNGNPRVAAHCLGSGCMAWRWIDADTPDGFCGLAGHAGMR